MTTTLPTTVASTEPFVALMEKVWADRSEPLPDGGLRLFTSDWYDDWHDARKVAKYLGAKRLWAAGKRLYTWQFPDGTRVVIGMGGNMVRPVQRHL